MREKSSITVQVRLEWEWHPLSLVQSPKSDFTTAGKTARSCCVCRRLEEPLIASFSLSIKEQWWWYGTSEQNCSVSAVIYGNTSQSLDHSVINREFLAGSSSNMWTSVNPHNTTRAAPLLLMLLDTLLSTNAADKAVKDTANAGAHSIHLTLRMLPKCMAWMRNPTGPCCTSPVEVPAESGHQSAFSEYVLTSIKLMNF